MKPVDTIRRVVDTVADAEGVEIVELKIDGGSRRIRAVIDREPDPVNVDDCSRLNRAVRRALEETDGIDADAFHVDVMSPGVNRRLVRDKDFARFAGEAVRVRLRQKRDGKRNLDGTLVERTPGEVVIRTPEDGEVRVQRADVLEVRLDPFRT